MEKQNEWVLPAGFPFEDLKGRDLEECLYWLADSMGARDLEWRLGGTGGGAADGGRDLEAIFYVPGPDGEMEPQRWWIECKGRKGTLEADEVKSAVLNAAARTDLAYLVIATNTTFSNPTRDWVKQWQDGHPRPRVKLWDRGALERLLTQHPNVVLRLFARALSASGLLKAVELRFWERLEYMPEKALQTFWAERASIDIDPLARVALIANEFAHGSIVDRPWASAASPIELIQTINIAFTNLAYLKLRLLDTGVDQQPVIAALAHLIIAGLQVTHAEKLTIHLIEDCLGGKDPVAEDVVEMLLGPVIDRVAGEIQDLCSADCSRMLGTEASTLAGEQDPVETYWRRFVPDADRDQPDEHRHLRLERFDQPCKVGYALDRENCCPLFDRDLKPAEFADFLSVVERVTAFRIREGAQKAAQETARNARRRHEKA